MHNLKFQGRKATSSMTSKFKTETRFGLGVPSYLLGPVIEAAISPFQPVEAVEKLVSYSKKNKNRILPR